MGTHRRARAARTPHRVLVDRPGDRCRRVARLSRPDAPQARGVGSPARPQAGTRSPRSPGRQRRDRFRRGARRLSGLVGRCALARARRSCAAVRRSSTLVRRAQPKSATDPRAVRSGRSVGHRSRHHRGRERIEPPRRRRVARAGRQGDRLHTVRCVQIQRFRHGETALGQADALQVVALAVAAAAVVVDTSVVLGACAVGIMAIAQAIGMRRTPISPAVRIGVVQTLAGASVVVATALGVLKLS